MYMGQTTRYDNNRSAHVTAVDMRTYTTSVSTSLSLWGCSRYTGPLDGLAGHSLTKFCDVPCPSGVPVTAAHGTSVHTVVLITSISDGEVGLTSGCGDTASQGMVTCVGPSEGVRCRLSSCCLADEDTISTNRDALGKSRNCHIRSSRT